MGGRLWGFLLWVVFWRLVWGFLWVYYFKKCSSWRSLPEFSVSSNQMISSWNDIACPFKRQYDFMYPYFKIRL